MFKEREELYSFISILLSPNISIFCKRTRKKIFKDYSNFISFKYSSKILLYLNELLQLLPDKTVHSKQG